MAPIFQRSERSDQKLPRNTPIFFQVVIQPAKTKITQLHFDCQSYSTLHQNPNKPWLKPFKLILEGVCSQ